MTTPDAILRAIADHPWDETPRLLYADWLDDAGQPERAEFVRVQVGLDRFAAGDPARRPLVVRHLHFLKEFVPGWRAELPRLPGVEWGDFCRGLVEEVQVADERALTEHAAAIFAEPAVHVVRLARLVNGRRLAGVPELARVRWLRLISYRHPAREESVRELLRSPHLARLKALELDGNEAADRVAADLADGRFPELGELWLGQNRITDAGGRALADGPGLDRLHRLDLSNNRIDDPGVRAALVRRFGSAVKL